MEVWTACRPMLVADSHHFGEEQKDPNPHESGKSYSMIRINVKRCIRIRIFIKLCGSATPVFNFYLF